jgi:hypothetical protein
MILAWLILILSTAMFFFCFYFQATCQKILGRQFGREFFRSVVDVHRLEFLAVQSSLAEAGLVLASLKTRRD